MKFLSKATALSFAIVACLFLLSAWSPVSAQEISIDFGDETTLTQRVIQLVLLMTVLSLAPSILIMVTSFVRIVVVLSMLRTAMGTQSAPPNIVIVSLAMFLTAFVMAPTFQKAYEGGIGPWMAGDMEFEQAYEGAAKPIKQFMLAQVREKDVGLFLSLTDTPPVEEPAATPMQILIPAFMISELRRAFEIGFLLFVPFLIIDLVIASVLMAMGMMMLPPIVISMPFKLIFFVLVDGWFLVAGSLVQSFNPV